MGVDPLRDVEHLFEDEPGWGGSPTRVNISGDFTHLPAGRVRKAAKERAIKRQQKWKKALTIRETEWTEADFIEEEKRLEREVAEHVARKAA